MKPVRKIWWGKAAVPSQVNMDMIIARGKFGVGVMKKLYQRVLNGIGKPEEWKTSVVVAIFKGKGDVMDCGAYRGVKLLEHAMKIVERVLENRIRGLVTGPAPQGGLLPPIDMLGPPINKLTLSKTAAFVLTFKLWPP